MANFLFSFSIQITKTETNKYYKYISVILINNGMQ